MNIIHITMRLLFFSICECANDDIEVYVGFNLTELIAIMRSISGRSSLNRGLRGK